MFIPNNTGFLTPLERRDMYGDVRLGTPVQVPCGVVHLNKKVQPTTVRSDSSGSRGAAEEFVSVSKILFPANLQIATGMKFEIAGFALRVTLVEPRYAVAGRLDHYEVDLEQWT